MNYHAVTNTFSHSEGSCMNFPPTNKWNYSIPNVIDKNNPTIFVDHCISIGMKYPKKYKFGWLCESSEIIFEVNKWVKENTHLLEQYYEKIFVNDESFLSLSKFNNLTLAVGCRYSRVDFVTNKSFPTNPNTNESVLIFLRMVFDM